MPRLIKLKGHSYKNFSIDQAQPKPTKLGRGPYAIYLDDREIKRRPRYGDCRDDLEQIVQEKWQLDARIRDLKSQFCAKWNLPRYPESS